MPEGSVLDLRKAIITKHDPRYKYYKAFFIHMTPSGRRLHTSTTDSEDYYLNFPTISAFKEERLNGEKYRSIIEDEDKVWAYWTILGMYFGGPMHVYQELIKRGWKGFAECDIICLEAIDAVMSIRETANTEIVAGRSIDCWGRLMDIFSNSFCRIFSFRVFLDELSWDFYDDLSYFARIISSTAKSLKHLGRRAQSYFDYIYNKSLYDCQNIALMFLAKYGVEVYSTNIQNADYVPPLYVRNVPRSLSLNGRLRIQSTLPPSSGGFGVVYRGGYEAILEPPCIVEVAVKVILSHRTSVDQEKLQRRLKRELRVWQSLKHPYLLPLFGIITEMGPYDSMVSPWCNGGSLSSFISRFIDTKSGKVEYTLPMQVRMRLLHEISDALSYLHSRSVVHGDLTDGNVLISDWHVKLCDFGLSSIVEEIDGVPITMTSSKGQGTLRYMAPELLMGQGARTSKESDVYSFGLIAFMVLTGLKPFYNINVNFTFLVRFHTGQRFTLADYDNDGMQLGRRRWKHVKACSAENPCLRPSAEDIKQWYIKQHELELEMV